LQNNPHSYRQDLLKIIERESIINGRFENIKRLNKNGGDGAFSLIFTADDTILEEKIILKFFDPYQYTASGRFERFKRESKLLALLYNEDYVINCVDGGRHTLTIMLFDKKANASFPIMLQYLAMEKADYDAEHFIYKMHSDPIKILTVFREMYKAVDRLHKNHIPHRDLKPNNFLFISDRVCLGDLGTAKCMDGSMPDISSNYINPVGHTQYISPEINFSIGIADDYVYKSDMFSLGAILFEMFTNTVFTSQIYDQKFYNNCRLIINVLNAVSPNSWVKIYRESVSAFRNTVNLPDIYAYNDKVPNSIKYRLNDLYKALVDIDFTRRLSNSDIIYRKLNICIKILSNQKIYDSWLEEKRRRQLIRAEKENRKNRKYNDN